MGKKLTHKVVWDDTMSAVEKWSDGTYDGWYEGHHTKKHRTLKAAKIAAQKLRYQVNHRLWYYR